MQKYIIWDWNGTLLNDVDIAVENINILLKKYNINQIDKQTYRSIFEMPVINFYVKVGFDFTKTPFDIVGKEYIDLYNNKLHLCSLYDNALDILQIAKNKGYRNVILSARLNETLKSDLEFFGVTHLIDEFYGIDNIYGTSKEYLFEFFLKDKNLQNIIYVGDTTHDLEIAKKYGLKFFLFTEGHQGPKHFENKNSFVRIEKLAQLIDYLE